MFPFTLPGQSFLAFYAGLSAVMLFGFWLYARSGGEIAGASGLEDLTSDPYKIAFLRGADEETVRIACFNLVDRGIMGYVGTAYVVSDKANAELLRRPLDRAILAKCAQRASFKQLVADPGVRVACRAYESELSNAGLLRGGAQQNAVLGAFWAVLGLLGGLAIVRILQALSRGRFNIVFLVVLALAACAIAFSIYASRKTSAGSRKLGSLETLMGRLKARAPTLESGGATNEALLAAAVFGLAILPIEAFPFLEQMFPRPRPADTSSGSDSSWDSGSSSGGSSCGGGGSGCGGCGGGGD